MSITTITPKWEPAKRTIEALKKRGITYEQVKPVLVDFRMKKNNKQVKDASTVFYNLFDKVYGHAMPKPDRTADKEQAEARKANFEAKAENSAERAEEVKGQKGAMPQDDARRWINLQRGLPQDHGIIK